MCEQIQYGFDCVCEHVREYPGENWYTCEWCGLYQASRPRCNQCEESEKDTLKIRQPAFDSREARQKQTLMKEALERSNQAFHDLLVGYAMEQHTNKQILEAGKRVRAAGGTLAYVADALKQNREALGEE